MDTNFDTNFYIRKANFKYSCYSQLSVASCFTEPEREDRRLSSINSQSDTSFITSVLWWQLAGALCIVGYEVLCNCNIHENAFQLNLSLTRMTI